LAADGIWVERPAVADATSLATFDAMEVAAPATPDATAVASPPIAVAAEVASPPMAEAAELTAPPIAAVALSNTPGIVTSAAARVARMATAKVIDNFMIIEWVREKRVVGSNSNPQLVCGLIYRNSLNIAAQRNFFAICTTYM
jgi:hypothetical protein